MFLYGYNQPLASMKHMKKGLFYAYLLTLILTKVLAVKLHTKLTTLMEGDKELLV